MVLLFFMTVGTFLKVSSFEDKKKRIDKSNLAFQNKEGEVKQNVPLTSLT